MSNKLVPYHSNQMCSGPQIIFLQEHWLYPDELPLLLNCILTFLGFVCFPSVSTTNYIYWSSKRRRRNVVAKYIFHKASKLSNMTIVVLLDWNSAIIQFCYIFCVCLPYKSDMFYYDYYIDIHISSN